MRKAIVTADRGIHEARVHSDVGEVEPTKVGKCGQGKAQTTDADAIDGRVGVEGELPAEDETVLRR